METCETDDVRSASYRQEKGETNVPNYKRIIQLSEQNISQRRIEKEVHSSRHTIGAVLDAAKLKNIRYRDIADFSDEKIEELLGVSFSRTGKENRLYEMPDYEYCARELKKPGVTKSCLSAVELGKRAVPAKWFDIIVDHYHLKDYPAERIRQAIYESRPQIRILLNGKENYKRDLALRFEEAFDSIDEETADKILLLLKPENREIDGSSLT